MTSVATERAGLHPMPRWGAAFREQLAVTGMAVRWEGALLLAILVVAAWSSISDARHLAENWSTTGALSRYETTAMMLRDIGIHVFGAGAIALLAVFALFLPAAVWRGTDAPRRDYLAAMPLSAPAHALLKVAAGWAWLMAGVAVFSVGMIATALVAESILGDAPVPVRLRGGDGEAWLWIVPFTGVSITYLAGSALALTTRHPSRYLLLGTVAIVATSIAIGKLVGAMVVIDPVETLFEGRLGLGAAIAGVVSTWRRFAAESGSMTTGLTMPDLDRWIPAMLLWLSLALGAVVLAAYRRRD